MLKILNRLISIELRRNYRKVRDLSFSRYTKGLTNMMEFLDRENDLINAEQNLVAKETQSLIDLIALYKSLGGGWQCCSDMHPIN